MATLYSQPNTVPVGSGESVPINIDFSPHMVIGDVLTPVGSKLTLDGAGTVITPSDAPTVLATTVAASPAPTASSFTVQPGIGAQLLAFDPERGNGAGMVLTIARQIGTVQSIVGDLVTLTTPLPATPSVGDVVTSTFVQQIVRGSQLTVRQSYRLDVTGQMNPTKEMTVSTTIPCKF